ncbi:M20 aminoacylase family protein [Rhodopseudomonas palustris]|uniref:M20 aminoacylase family protein n=1 Tax=Rhodopseudomonas palustris TaxID=1076 RepID=UPI002ACEE965|nr:M20 aminoacylase family protein [Rhodopseudomonas palustris]WQG97837.1 M20 aminoacylase family protein [Rhodopseudomonas palustris]
MPIENWTARYLDELKEFRHDLHRNPELLYDVHRTAQRVAARLREAGVDEVHEGIGGTGVVGIIYGQSRSSGRMIGLRADMDALPILEATGAEWASQVPGKMHACGHDGHTTMLLGAALGLVESRAFDGGVALIFQPAEEGGAGAKAMLDDGLLQRFPIQEFYGMHNRPGLPLGSFATGPGPQMGSVDEIIISIEGRGGHAAQPHATVDPVVVAAALIQATQAIVARNLDPLQSAVISITQMTAGDAFNVIPQTVTLRGTVRTLDEPTRDMVEKRLRELTESISTGFGAVGTLSYLRHYPVMRNSEVGVDRAVAAAGEVAGAAHVDAAMAPTLGGEDFAFMLNERPGAMIMIGNGDSAPLHHPRFDFNDDVIPWGCSYWTALVRQRMPLV